MFRFKANRQLLKVLETTEYSSGTYHCVVIDKNDQTHSADIKLGKLQLFFNIDFVICILFKLHFLLHALS